MSEGWLVLLIGLLTLVGLVALMTLGSGRSLNSGEGGATAASLEAELEQLRNDLLFAQQEAEDKETSVVRLRQAVEELKALQGAAGDAGGLQRELDAAMAERAALTEENAKLGREIEELAGELALLSLAPDLAEPGEGMAELEPARTRTDLAPKVLQDIRVVDVNPDIQFAVIDVGQEHGIVPGMEFKVMRDNEIIAQVSAEDVRELLTGVTVQETQDNVFPQAGDRAVLVTSY